MSVLKRNQYDLEPKETSSFSQIPEPAEPETEVPSRITVAPIKDIQQTSAPAPPVHHASSSDVSEKPVYSPRAAQADFQKNLTAQRAQADQELDAYRRQKTEEAESEKQLILDKAYEEGLEKGREAAEAELNEKSKELLTTISDLVHEKEKVLTEAKDEILQIALKVAEQIVKSEISLNQAVCINIISEAIGKVTEKDRVIIRVNRSDVEFVKANQDRIWSHMSDIKNLVIQDDERVEAGGCIIETDLGYIDSTIDTKLENIRRAVAQVQHDESDEERAAAVAASSQPEPASEPVAEPEDVEVVQDNLDNSPEPAAEAPEANPPSTPPAAEVEEDIFEDFGFEDNDEL